jgi:nucleoside-diphosphate-sugar epimerase
MTESAGILITGGAGFIGSHLAEALVARGRRVRVLDAYVSDTRRLAEAIGWHPRVPVRAGIARLRAWLCAGRRQDERAAAGAGAQEA